MTSQAPTAQRLKPFFPYYYTAHDVVSSDRGCLSGRNKVSEICIFPREVQAAGLSRSFRRCEQRGF
jgi:hypothetical protein